MFGELFAHRNPTVKKAAEAYVKETPNQKTFTVLVVSIMETLGHPTEQIGDKPQEFLRDLEKKNPKLKVKFDTVYNNAIAAARKDREAIV